MHSRAIGRVLLTVLAAWTMVACGAGVRGPSLTVGAAPDSQNTLLANIYAAGLRYYGTAADVQVSDDPLAALDAGKVTVATGFTGRLLQRFNPGSTARSAEQVYRALAGALPEGIAVGDYATAADDKPALAVTEATASTWGTRDLAALVRNCSSVSVGALTGTTPPTTLGDCTLRPAREFATPAILFDALRSGAVTAAWTSTGAAGVPAGIVVLVDRPPTLVPAQNAVAIYRRNELGQLQLRAINEIGGVLDTASMVQMLDKVNSGADPRAVAEAWLADNPLGR
jgi:glycine betaine/choline ABC-type transport system substrate-binding protein